MRRQSVKFLASRAERANKIEVGEAGRLQGSPGLVMRVCVCARACVSASLQPPTKPPKCLRRKDDPDILRAELRQMLGALD